MKSDFPRYAHHVRVLTGPPDEKELNRIIEEVEAQNNELESITFNGRGASVLTFRYLTDAWPE